MTKHIFITGPMGVGKTTLAGYLAAELSCPLRDSDAHIEQFHKVSGREIAARDGVAYLHQLERDFIELAVQESEFAVVACAASVADSPTLLERVRADGHLLVYLSADVAQLNAAMSDASHRRPLPTAEAEVLTHQRRRNAIAAQAVVVDVTDESKAFKTVAAISAEVAHAAPSFFDG